MRKKGAICSLECTSLHIWMDEPIECMFNGKMKIRMHDLSLIILQWMNTIQLGKVRLNSLILFFAMSNDDPYTQPV